MWDPAADASVLFLAPNLMGPGGTPEEACEAMSGISCSADGNGYLKDPLCEDYTTNVGKCMAKYYASPDAPFAQLTMVECINDVYAAVIESKKCQFGS